MKIYLLIAISTLIFSCSIPEGKNEKKNSSGLNPSELNKQELYAIYGLEAPDQIYNDLKNNLEKQTKYQKEETFCERIEKENVLSKLVSVSIEVDELTVSKATIHYSDYSTTINSIIENKLEGITWNYELDSADSSRYFNFRLDMKTLCK